MMESHYFVEGNTAKAEITFVPRLENSHDVNELRCEAINEAIGEPLARAVKLKIVSDFEEDYGLLGNKDLNESFDQLDNLESDTIHNEENKLSTSDHEHKEFGTSDINSNEVEQDDENLYMYLERNQQAVTKILEQQEKEANEKIDYDQGIDGYYDEEYNDGEEEDYLYEYPEEQEYDESMLIHPELIHEQVFKHKGISTDTDDQHETVEHNSILDDPYADDSTDDNDVYPKDSPYTQGGNIVTAESGATNVVKENRLVSFGTMIATFWIIWLVWHERHQIIY